MDRNSDRLPGYTPCKGKYTQIGVLFFKADKTIKQNKIVKQKRTFPQYDPFFRKAHEPCILNLSNKSGKKTITQHVTMQKVATNFVSTIFRHLMIDGNGQKQAADQRPNSQHFQTDLVRSFKEPFFVDDCSIFLVVIW